SSSSAAPSATPWAGRAGASPPKRRKRRACSLTSPSKRFGGPMYVFKAAVVGAGTMGGEIAQVIAAAGLDVVLKDVEQKFVDQGLEKAEQVTGAQLGGLVKKEKITQEQADAQQKEILGGITGTTSYEGFGDVDFVIEAVPERMQIKQAVFE